MRRTTKQEALFDLQAPQTIAMGALSCLSVGRTDRMVHKRYERQRVKILQLGTEIRDLLPCIRSRPEYILLSRLRSSRAAVAT